MVNKLASYKNVARGLRFVLWKSGMKGSLDGAVEVILKRIIKMNAV
jgi:hypothetical protein